MAADALSRKSSGSIAQISIMKRSLIQELHQLVDQGLMMKTSRTGGLLAQFQIRSVLRNMIKTAQSRDPILAELQENVRSGKSTDFTLDNEGILWISGRLCVPDVDDLRKEILEESHSAAYSVHPGVTKMYHGIKGLYWWDGLKKDVADYVSKCLTCQQVKAEHQKPSGKLQPLPIPEWK